VMIAVTVAQKVAIKVEPTIPVGFFEPLMARILMAVAGTSWIELVLIARKVHMALVATPCLVFSSFSWTIARKPSGVAALLTPSILAAMFITIDPIAGWSGGTSENRRTRIGRMNRAICWMSPAFSASRTMPSQRVMAPQSGSATSMTADLAALSAP